MKKYINLILLAVIAIFSSCQSDDSITVDDRLLGEEITFSHINPRTGAPYTGNDDRPYNEFQDFYRSNMNVELDIESTYEIERIEVVSLLKRELLETLQVNGTSASFSHPVADLNVPFAQSSPLLFHVYFNDRGVKGFDYPSMKSFTYLVSDDVPSPVSFKRADGSITEVKTTTINVASLAPAPQNGGIIATFKPNEISCLQLENASYLKFGNNRSFSFSFWFRSDHNVSDPAMIGTMNWNSSNNTGWVLAYRRGNLRLVAGEAGVGKVDFAEPSEGEGGTPWMTGQWHFVTCVLDRAGTAAIYVDGQLSAERPMTQTNLDNDNPIYINQDGTGTYGDRLGAAYRKIVIYDYALSPQQVASEFEASKIN
ncbi:LamG domain-containing protein [Lunatimonas salinarum]|uniref:LamG domain-containing protein n=1 Tax=Lunatimonas salinarum TaxID=1774590 RepID=UPI001ADEBF12|nr:LamG domain-containing protein [Lunatimonas salinarum]